LRLMSDVQAEATALAKDIRADAQR
jgi:hypothetical protein